MLQCDNVLLNEFTEIFMELVILSTVAALAILAAELRDLAGREHMDRSVAPATPRLTAIAGLASDVPAAQQHATHHDELDRAA